MTIKVWNYSKKENSSARPSDSALHEYTITLKERCSFNSPVFVLNLGGSLPDFNYVYWEDIDYYYYVSDIVSRTNEVFEIVCSLDALATARQYLINSTGFVKYSTLNFDPYLKDDRIIPTAEIESVVFNNAFTDLNVYEGYTSDYCYLLTTFSQGNGLATYLINMTELRYIITKLIDDGDSVIGGVKQIFADAKGSIIDLRTCPINRTALQQQNIVGQSSTPIFLGSYDTGQSGYLLDSYKYEVSDLLSFTIPSNFTLCEPYTSAKLHLPLIGVCDFSVAELQDVSSIKFKMICNLANGNVSYIIWKGAGSINDSSNKILGTYSGNASIELPLSFNQSKNPAGILSGIASLGASLLGGAFTVGGIAGAVASFSSYFTKSTSVIGAFNGNFATNGNTKLSLTLIKHGLSEQPENMAQLYGRPCGKVINFSGLVNGYVQTTEFHFQAPFDKYIINEVESYMDSGVYLE